MIFDEPSFWKHELIKHKSCTNFTNKEYIDIALTLFLQAQSYNFYDCCNHRKINCLLPYSLNFTFEHCYSHYI